MVYWYWTTIWFYAMPDFCKISRFYYVLVLWRIKNYTGKLRVSRDCFGANSKNRQENQLNQMMPPGAWSHCLPSPSKCSFVSQPEFHFPAYNCSCWNIARMEHAGDFSISVAPLGLSILRTCPKHVHPLLLLFSTISKKPGIDFD